MEHTVDTILPAEESTEKDTGPESCASDARAELASPAMMRLLVFVPVVLLVVFGIVMIFSASMVFSLKRFGEPTYFFFRQLAFGGLGLVVLVVASRLPVEVYRKFTVPLLAASFIGLVLCLTPLATTVKGASRWISIAGGVNIQPSEIAKIAIVFYLSYLMSKKADVIKSFKHGFLPPLVVSSVFAAMCLKQPDFGAAAMIMVLAFVLLFVGGTRIWYLLVTVVPAALALGVAVYTSEYRMKRIMAFMNPEQDVLGVNYQINESLISIGSGGIFGVGLGNGKQKLFFLPDAHTDFIASIVAEELGLIGIAVLLILFGVLVAAGIKIATMSRTRYGSFLAAGLTFYIAFQVVTNLQVVMSLLPTKGLALPFMSYGGSSLVMNMFAAGVLMAVASNRKGATKETHPELGRFTGNVRMVPPPNSRVDGEGESTDRTQEAGA